MQFGTNHHTKEGKIIVIVSKKYWLIMYGVSAVIFCLGFIIWLMAYLYEPVTHSSATLQRYTIKSRLEIYPFERYQTLMSGRLFFGGSDIPVDINPIVQFHSRLILWGVIKGGHAVVGLDPGSNLDTKLIKAGDEVEGERIISVGEKYILVRNQTGQGKVVLIGE